MALWLDFKFAEHLYLSNDCRWGVVGPRTIYSEAILVFKSFCQGRVYQIMASGVKIHISPWTKTVAGGLFNIQPQLFSLFFSSLSASSIQVYKLCVSFPLLDLNMKHYSHG